MSDFGRQTSGRVTYELFLDENGENIQITRQGLSVDEWLEYATPESLALYMYNSPKKAKRLYFDAIPRYVDDYLTHLDNFETQEGVAQLENPAWHIHNGVPPSAEGHITFGLLLNLVSVCNSEDPLVLWGFITRYAPDATPKTAPILDKLVDHAIAYYRDFVKPNKNYRLPTEKERVPADLVNTLKALPTDDAETIQKDVYAVGKRHDLKTFATGSRLLRGIAGPKLAHVSAHLQRWSDWRKVSTLLVGC